MNLDTLAGQVRFEADRVAAVEEKAQARGAVPRSEVIESQPRERYRPPAFLEKTATAGEREELARLFGELHELNQGYVGACTKEIEIALFLSGVGKPLFDRLRIWCDGYFGRRVVLGAHGPNREVRWPIVVCLLKRLGVTAAEWQRAVYGGET